MKWAHFLHIYQPSAQHPGILDKIVNESYRPILRGLYKTENAKITLNINSVLTELLFEHGYRDVVDDIKALVEMGKIELVGSAKFHPFLPLLPEDEARRQIELNHETNSRYFGDAFAPTGFFSPEMGYSPKVANLVKEMGYKWMLADESALTEPEKVINAQKTFEIEGLGLKVFFREKHPTNLIMGALVRSSESLKKAMGDRIEQDGYVITAMDGETFGHHRPGLDKALFEILGDKDLENVFISELPDLYPEIEKVKPLDSTWATSIKEVQAGNPFAYWYDNGNEIHELEWQLASIAINAVKNSNYSDKNYPRMLEEEKNWDDLSDEEKHEEEKKRAWVKSRDMLDKALNSDPWWWACATPWWSIEEIEKGMNALLKVVSQVPDADDNDNEEDRARELYGRILMMGHEWQRTGKVDKMKNEDSESRKIPLSKRFGAQDHYKALLQALKEEETMAAENREYEKAIKWRDGQYKLERDLDIYDAVHVMDMFRNEGNFAKFEQILSEYRKKYQEISRGQPE